MVKKQSILSRCSSAVLGFVGRGLTAVFNKAVDISKNNPLAGLLIGLGFVLFMTVGLPILISSILSAMVSGVLGILLKPIPLAITSLATMTLLQIYTSVKPFSLILDKTIDLAKSVYNWLTGKSNQASEQSKGSKKPDSQPEAVADKNPSTGAVNIGADLANAAGKIVENVLRENSNLVADIAGSAVKKASSSRP